MSRDLSNWNWGGIVGKVVCLATRVDAELVCGTDQHCCGVKCGIEGAVHTMNDLFAVHSDSAHAWGSCLSMLPMHLTLLIKWLYCGTPVYYASLLPVPFRYLPGLRSLDYQWL